MNVYRTILSGIFVMAIACLYVNQHVEIVRQGYSIQEKRKNLSTLVDRNSALMYNLSKLESPRNLLSSIESENMKFIGKGIQTRGKGWLVSKSGGR